MGLKSLSLQMIPWCFHVVGATCRPALDGEDDDDGYLPDNPKHSSSPAGPVRVIGSDGRVRIYDRPVGAAEVMKDNPRHLVCRSDSFFIGQRVPPLAAGDQLQPGHSYFLLPSHFFHSVLSFVTLAASFADSTKKPPLLRPFDIHKTPAGALQIRVSDEFLDRLRMEEEEMEEMERRGRRVCTTEALEKDYRQLVRSRSWKPKLETIRESERKRRSRGLTFGGIRRRKKRNHKASHSEEEKNQLAGL
ncbi:uncharacterized protein [Elaeis guineensis]|uniref:Uncharacterized protein LOC105036165 n=1 Tax=Elaeis guineensis var. tenera TaxID=51953 RepID=A0A6I9QIS2_ELAGV|nr:uncharacterized protein LOC105036165 [Elaeis guineensis]